MVTAENSGRIVFRVLTGFQSWYWRAEPGKFAVPVWQEREGSPSMGFASLSPDGRYLAGTVTSQDEGLAVLDLDTGSVAEAPQFSQKAVGLVRWADQGRAVLFVTESRELWRLPVNTAASR